MNARADRAATDLLIEAGAVLASSLDLATTMRQVAGLTVPSLADICVIDLRGEDGTISEVAVVSEEARLAEQLEAMRRMHPLDPDGAHPVACVIRTGEPALLPEMSNQQLDSFAAADEHARFMIESAYRSAIVAPLVARSQTVGALSLLRLGDSPPYDEVDLELACELARRAALALDNARMFGELQRLDGLQQAILTNLAEAITVEDEHGRTVFSNQAAAELLLADSPADVVSAAPGSLAARFLLLDEQGRELVLDELPGRRLFRGERAAPLLVRNIVRATGEERWLIVRSSPISDPATGRMLLAVNVLENITEVKRAQLAESFMAQASRVLASSMDYGETLRRVARLAVPTLADWCAIHLVGSDGELVQVAVHHTDPAKVALAERLDRLQRRAPRDAGAIPEVIRTGSPRVYSSIDPDALAAHARDAEHLQMLQAIGATAVIIVPLLSAVQAIGAITLVSSESLRRLTLSDVALAERLGRRAGTAVENARLYTERARIAHTLQRALLPERLPELPGAAVAARYHAAGELNEVGGDFYDVVRRDHGGWMLMIGDVIGKGARAAGVTALARHTLRASSMAGSSPAEMLRALHRALREQPAGADMCTVCLVDVTCLTGRARLTVALAGHPPPLLIDPNGKVVQIGRPGTVLGVIDPIQVRESELDLDRGQTLLLYTDGLIDAGRGGSPLGERGLLELVRSAAGLPLDSLLERIESDALARAEGGLRDDTALLAMRLR